MLYTTTAHTTTITTVHLCSSFTTAIATTNWMSSLYWRLGLC